MSAVSGVRTLRLTVEYDGTPFAGWQIQDAACVKPTVQGALEDALKEMCGQPIALRGASRTDAGVHALGQVAAFDTCIEHIPAIGFERGPRRFLPAEVVIRRAEDVARGWDPRRTSRGKRYIYSLWHDPAPTALLRCRAWWVRGQLDLPSMREAAAHLVGTHDFGAFRAAGCVARHAVRTLHTIQIRRVRGPLVEIEVVGNAFVRNMVRIIAGTLVEVGQGRRRPDEVARALEDRERRSAGVTAPAHGLCLDEVIYDTRLPPRPEDDRDLSG